MRMSAIAGKSKNKAAVISSANLSFHSFFKDIKFGAAQGAGTSWTKPLVGVDSITGAVFPTGLDALFGANTGIYIDMPAMDVSCADEAALDARLTSAILPTTGGAPLTNDLVLTTLVKDIPSIQQSHLMIFRDAGAAYPNGVAPAEIRELFIRTRIFVPANIESLLTNGQYYTVFEFKTGGYQGSWKGDYRCGLSINKGGASSFWRAKLDSGANGNDGTCPGATAEGGGITTYQDNYLASGSVQTGWHTIEISLRRPLNRADVSSGLTKITVTSDATGIPQEVCNFVGGIQMGADDLPINRLVLCANYSDSITRPHFSQINSFEIWNKTSIL